MKKTLFILGIYCLLTGFSINTIIAQAGYAINFQNLDYMTHGDFAYCGQPDYGFTDKLTITAWVKWTTDPQSFAVTPTSHENEGTYSTYVAYGSHNSNDIASDNGQFWLRNAKTGNKFEFLVENSSNTIITASSPSYNPNEGQWYFLAGVYDGSHVILYVGGVLANSSALTGNIKLNDGTHRLNMGKLPWGYGFFVGYLDEVRIWNVALTQAEVQQQMTSIATVRLANLKSHWNFDRTTSTQTTIDDSGPQNADGIFYSCAIDVHGFTNSPPYTVSDYDKTWIVNNWSGYTLKTVSGAGVDETNTIVSNTSNTATLQNAFGTTPVLDGKTTTNDTWFGVEKSNETTQWVVSDIPLPVELISLAATFNEKAVILNWQTATEVNNYGFEVQKSVGNNESGVNGNWDMIGFIEGNGNSNSTKQYSFIDKDIANGSYSYRLKQIDIDGSYSYSDVIEVACNTQPSNFELFQNYPNPFNPVTVISFQLPVISKTQLKIYDVLGSEVATLVNETKEPGVYEIKFDASQLPSGIYFYRIAIHPDKIQAGEFVQTHKMLLIK